MLLLLYTVIVVIIIYLLLTVIEFLWEKIQIYYDICYLA